MGSDVLIVGAGPSGLALANVLAAYGVDFRIVDSKSGPVPESRANLVHVRTLELLDRLGLAGRMVALGVRITHVEIYERGRRAAEFPLVGGGAGTSTPYPYLLGLSQHTTERLLAEAVTERGRSVEWGIELLDLHDSESGVAAMVRSRDGTEETISARWAVAADGASSPVRHALGLNFAGSTYEQIGLLADVDLDLVPGERLAGDRLRLNLTRGGFVGMVCLGPHHYRLFGALPPGMAVTDTRTEVSHEAYAHVSPADIQRWFDEFFMVDARLTNVAWTALFRTHSRITERFRVGNVFLIGDAAHIHSPAGGQGMNLGIGDAVNLGWKLALVACGQAHERLLDSYHAERYPVAKRVLTGADHGFSLETTDHPIGEWARAHIGTRLIGPLTRLSAVRNLIFKLLSQTWISYRGSPIVTQSHRSSRRSPRAGDRLIHGHSNSMACSQPGITRHHLILDGMPPSYGETAVPTAIEELLRSYAISVDVHTELTHQPAPRRHATGARLYLVRPDGHIAYTGPVDDLAGLSRYLDQLYTRRPAPSRSHRRIHG